MNYTTWERDVVPGQFDDVDERDEMVQIQRLKYVKDEDGSELPRVGKKAESDPEDEEEMNSFDERYYQDWDEYSDFVDNHTGFTGKKQFVGACQVVSVNDIFTHSEIVQ